MSATAWKTPKPYKPGEPKVIMEVVFSLFCPNCEQVLANGKTLAEIRRMPSPISCNRCGGIYDRPVSLSLIHQHKRSQ